MFCEVLVNADVHHYITKNDSIFCISRKNEVISSVSCGAPPEKKPSNAETPSKTLCSDLASMEVVSPVTKEAITKKIIKLKRPGKTVPATSS